MTNSLVYSSNTSKSSASADTADEFPVFDLLKPFPCHACHRGGCSTFGPENTMYSYRRSVWECNTQVLEIDLQITSDGHLILMHDSTFDRTTNGTGPCRSMTLEETRKLDAAWHYPNLRGQGIQLPTFDEFLDEFLPNQKLVFFLDFKEVDAATKTLEVVKQRGFDKRIILGSVVPVTNTYLAGAKPDYVPLTTDAGTTIKFTLWLSLGIKCDWKHDIYGYFLLPATAHFFGENIVKQIHNQGKKVVVAGNSTSNVDTLKQLIAWGVDIIMTDRPDLLSELMGRTKKEKE